ncbi:MAG: hypothetical protein ACREJC_00410 [Tepidisphaeraceae bacterium]
MKGSFMRWTHSLAILSLAAVACGADPASKQADVPVKAVVLFSSGVGYFEHFGTVQGDGSTELRFKTNQINDILKSLLLQDMDGGKVTTITYPSQDPIAKTLRSFQVDITGNPPLGDLLNQLRGAKVTLIYADQKLTGTILGVEKKQVPVNDNKAVIERPALNLLVDGGIKSVYLEDVREIQLDDPQLQEELGKALSALAQARDQDKKPVTINFTGQGERHVRLGYVVETPVWKTSYRLILDGQGAGGEGQAGKGGNLQGWAIVENQTDNDWNNVQLSLVSGRPISFVQDLYQPLYIPRPVVQPELYASLRPQTYEDGLERDKDVAQLQDQLKAKAPGRAAGGRQYRENAAAAAPMAAESTGIDRPLDATASVASIASASKVGELFQYTVGNVSLPRQKSAMIPIITDPVEVERLSIYNASVLPKNPLNGARVKNTTDKHLLAGPITVIDASTYAGDARIDNLPPGQERLLSYGIDLQMKVDSTSNKQESAVQTGKIVKGVLYVQRKFISAQDYVADNKSDHDKALIVEHPRRANWKLVDTDKPIEETDQLYRFKGAVAAGKASKLTVKEEMIQDESMAILNADPGTLDFYRRTGEIPQGVRDALARAMQLRQAVVDAERQLVERDAQISVITQEQSRIRENMKTVDRQSQYYNRLVTKLNDQESQIEKLQTERQSLFDARGARQKELEDYLNGLNV